MMIEIKDWQWLNKKTLQQHELQNGKENQLCLSKKNSPTKAPNELREREGPYLVLVLSMKGG